MVFSVEPDATGEAELTEILACGIGLIISIPGARNITTAAVTLHREILNLESPDCELGFQRISKFAKPSGPKQFRHSELLEPSVHQP